MDELQPLTLDAESFRGCFRLGMLGLLSVASLLPCVAASPKWIWRDAVPQTNSYARFKAELPETAVKMRISAAGNFAAFVDGASVGFGQFLRPPSTRLSWKRRSVLATAST